MRNDRMFSRAAKLLGATALTLSMQSAAFAQTTANCRLVGGRLPAECVQPDAGTANGLPIGANTEPSTAPERNTDGFVLSIDGQAIDVDPRITNQIRRTDVALAQADIRVTFDGLNPQPRLNIETVGQPRGYRAGDNVTLKSEMNYPAFVTGGELRIIDRGAAGGPRLLGTLPLSANGTATLTLPAGEDIVVVHRVRDSSGRFDETQALPLSRPDDRGLSSRFEEGADFTGQRNIPVRGGAVTVSAKQVAWGATLYTLGEAVQADPSGNLVIQRILPAGDHSIDVAVRGGAARRTELARDITIPGSEWFTFVLADITIGRYEDGQTGEVETRNTGRLRYYVDGETDSGLQVTSSLDTGEQELDEVFSRLDEKDPRSVVQRIDPRDTYPTFGDDSESFDNTPTSGRFYLRVERDNDFAMWGDYKNRIAGSHYLRNERSLYGAQAYYGAKSTTENGDTRASVSLYAAQPDQLVGRDVFRGTGGSVYFLRRQDITIGSETITVELRDADTGRVIDRRVLVAGRDYEVNYIQGYVQLSSPLSASDNPNLIQTNPGGDVDVNLVAQYEYTPTATDVDGMSYGGRAEVWATDDLRLGVTGTSDDTGSTDQTAASVDLRYEFGDNSFVQLDYAESDGPGYGSSYSADGGLTIDQQPANAGSGEAIRLEGQADFADLGSERVGVVGGYFEQRSAGFSTLDYQTADDETLYGAYVRAEADENTLGYAAYLDHRDTDGGIDKTEAGAELSGYAAAKLRYTLGAEYLDQDTASESGDRTVLAARLTYEATESLSYSIFGQGTVDSSGTLDDYDRYGVGVKRTADNGWSVSAEISDGTGGIGGRVLAEHSRSDNSSSYFGYELDPGRAIDAGISPDDNGGKYILGGRRHINDDVTVFGENAYDMFGSANTLISTYGVEYQATDFTSYDTALEFGQIDDATNGDFERTAVSLGVRHETDTLMFKGRAEYRMERADDTSPRADADTILLSADLRYDISDSSRVLFSFDGADTETDESSLLNGSLVDVSLGYAHRPIDNERLNVLTRYRYLYDMYGQDIDGTEETGPVQESHVFSVEANYDLTREWTVGGKLGGRLSESAIDDTTPLERNDAVLAVANARYKVDHNWEALLEVRHLEAYDIAFSETSALGVISRNVGDHVKVGVGYNFGSFSDDLTDLTYDDQGVFLNITASY